MAVANCAVADILSGMSLKSRHTRHRAKAPVSPRATRLSVRKVNRSKAKPKSAK
jgi:hypothetical protein